LKADGTGEGVGTGTAVVCCVPKTGVGDCNVPKEGMGLTADVVATGLG